MNHIKTAYLGLYASTIRFFNYYDIPAEGFALLFILLFADTILGVAKSYVLYGEQERWFSSNKLKIGIIGKVAILMCLLLFAMVIKNVVGNVGDIPLNTTLGLLITAEFISVLQNTVMIRTGKEIEEFDALTAVLKLILYNVKKVFRKNMVHDDPNSIKKPNI